MKILATAMLVFILLGGGVIAGAWALFVALWDAIDDVRRSTWK